MRDKIESLNESIEKYRPRDTSRRSSLADELQYLEGQLTESRSVCLKFVISVNLTHS